MGCISRCFLWRKPVSAGGIGRLLFEQALAQAAGRVLTVNASPYAVEIYQHLGFLAVTEEQLMYGIRFTPMRLTPRR